DRALQPPQCCGKVKRVGGAVDQHAKKPRACETRRSAAELRTDPGVAPGTCGKPVLFAVGGGHRWAHLPHLISFSGKDKVRVITRVLRARRSDRRSRSSPRPRIWDRVHRGRTV